MGKITRTNSVTVKKLKLKIGSDPYRLVRSIQQLSPSDVDNYIETQAERLAYNAALKEVQSQPHSGTGYEAAARQRRVHESKKHRIPGFIKTLSKYKIKVVRWERVSDEIVIAHWEELKA